MYSPPRAALLAGGLEEPNTRRYAARLPVALAREKRRIVDRFLRRNRRMGALDDLHMIGLVAGPSSGAGLRNMKGTHASAGILYGSGDFAPYRGLRGNGDSATPDTWINTGLAWGGVPGATASRHIAAVFCTENVEDGVGAITALPGGVAGAGTISIRPRSGTGAQILANAGASDTVRSVSALGFTGLFRNDAGVYVANKNGAESTIVRAAGAELPGGVITLLRSGTNGAFGKSRLAGWEVGAGLGLLTSADMRADHVDSWEEMMIALGAVLEEELHPPADSAPPPHFFTRASIASVTPVGMEVIQQLPPPADDATNLTFAGWPASIFETTDPVALVNSTATQATGGLFLWADRADDRSNNKPNLVPGPPFSASNGLSCRVEFSTVARAAASLGAKVAYHVGKNPREADGSGWLDIMESGDLPSSAHVAWALAQANRDAIFNGAATNGGPFAVARDLVVLPAARLCDAAPNMRHSLSIDYEVADLRSEQQTLSALLGPSAMIRAAGILAGLYLNPLNGGNAASEGVNDNTLWQLHDLFDFMTFALAFTGHGMPSLRDSILAQLALLDGPFGVEVVDFSRGMMTAGIGGYMKELSDADVATIRAFMTGTDPAYPGRKIRFLNLWRNGALLGGGPPGTPNRRVPKVVGGLTGLLVA